jgi:hypothetical protein
VASRDYLTRVGFQRVGEVWTRPVAA